MPPPGYYERLRELADKWGILLVADEIQTGMGRTGKWFAMEHWGVVPDITVLAKGIASGMPLGAMVARKELMDWPPGAHATTFGGNPVSCAAAVATIEVIEEEDLLANAAAMGEKLVTALEQMQSRHQSLGDVRGKGLVVGLELVKDKDSKEPATQLRDQVLKSAFESGLLLLGCGSSTVRFMPALTIDADTVDEGLAIFEEVLSQAEHATGRL